MKPKTASSKTKPAKKRPGPKRLPANLKKSEVLTVKVSKGDREFIYKAARKVGDKPYNWCRRMLLQAASKETGEPIPGN